MSGEISRKAVLAGAGVGIAAVAVAACSSGSEPGSSASSESAEPAGKTLTPAAAVPIGAGVIVNEVVVTQPTAGNFKAFSAVCTHTGCLVNKVADGTIDCPCHGSKFGLDGAVLEGPAKKPLNAVAIRVDGASIVTA